MSRVFEPFVVSEGEGRIVVLVHGSGSDHRTWDFVVPHLSDSYQVVRYDRRGHSRSQWAEPVLRRQDEDDLATLGPRFHFLTADDAATTGDVRVMPTRDTATLQYDPADLTSCPAERQRLRPEAGCRRSSKGIWREPCSGAPISAAPAFAT